MQKKKAPKPRRRKMRVFCRLYKYACQGCGKYRHKRHFVEIGALCTGCRKLLPPEGQESLFEPIGSNE